MSSSLLGADERCIHSIYRVTASATVMRTKDHYSSEWYGAVRDNSCLIACRELPPPTLLLLRLLKRCNVHPSQLGRCECTIASTHRATTHRTIYGSFLACFGKTNRTTESFSKPATFRHYCNCPFSHVWSYLSYVESSFNFVSSSSWHCLEGKLSR